MTEHAAEQDGPDVKEARDHWLTHFGGVRPDQLVFLDEFGATTDMARRHARGPRGERVVCKTPRGHWKVLSTIAAMTVSGVLGYGSFDGATDTETFLAFLLDGLVPRLLPGQVVVLDNLAAHKSPKVDELIESAGAKVLRLPPYSPDFNAIEMAVSKIKSILRKLARRTVDELIAAIDHAVAPVTADDALTSSAAAATPLRSGENRSSSRKVAGWALAMPIASQKLVVQHLRGQGGEVRIVAVQGAARRWAWSVAVIAISDGRKRFPSR